MAHVFICYDHQDRDFAELVQAKLERAGHTTSMDLDVLHAGDEWQDRLDDEIRKAQALVVLMTPEARASDYVAYEWAFALGAGVRVIPIELVETSFPARLDALHRLEFTDGARPWDTLLAEVGKAEALNPRVSVPVTPGAPAPVKEAVQALDSLNPEERLAGVRLLVGVDHPSAREALTLALEHPIEDVRAAAACVFPDRSDPRILPGLLAAGFGPSWDDFFPWTSLPYEVARIGAPAVPGLLDALGRETGEHRRMIIEALGAVGDASAGPALLDLLRARDETARQAAAEALGLVGYGPAVPGLRSAMGDPDAGVRARAAESLGILKATSAVPDLLRMLGEDVSRCRASAAVALGRIGDREATPALIAALGEDWSVRKAAVEALGLLGDADASLPLRELLEPRDQRDMNDLDNAVIVALLRLADRGSLPLIENRLRSFRSGTFGLARELPAAAAGLGGDLVDMLARVLDGASSKIVQREVATALNLIGTPEADTAAKAWMRKHG